MRSNFESKILFAFGAAVVVVALLSNLTWTVADEANHAGERVSHTHEILNNLARVRGDTLQIELATQSFRLSGNSALLIERDAAITQRETTLQRIRLLTANNPLQQQRWTRLRAVIDQRLALSRRIEMARKTQGEAAAGALAPPATLQTTRAQVYQLLDQMDETERQLLAQRQVEFTQSQRSMIGFGGLVALLLVILLAAAYLLIRRQLRQTERSQHALAASEEDLSTTLLSIGDAVLATDAMGCVTRMNPVAERLTGWSIDQARGRPVQDVFRIIHELTGEPAEAPIAAVLASGQVQGLANHTSLLARDGRVYPIADSAAPICDSEGRMHGVVLVFRDVTKERQAERVIREQNALLEQRVNERTTQWRESVEHLRSIISAVPALIAFVNAERRYVYVNEQYRVRFAVQREDITGCSVLEILGAERYAIAEPMIDLVLQGQPQSYDWEPFPDIWQTIRYQPKIRSDQQVEGYYVLGTDITERKLAEERIQMLNQELGQRVRELEHVSRALRTLSAGNRAMLRATDEPALLENMCAAIVETGGYGMAVVWYRVEGTDRLLAVAQSGCAEGASALEARLGGLERDTIAFAMRSGQVQLARDLPDWLGDSVSPTTDHSCLACPLWVNGQVIGALVIYDRLSDAFDADEVPLLTESSDDLAFGISTLRNRVERAKTQTAIHYQARHDALTGLPNETALLEALAAQIKSSRGQSCFAMLQLNIERLSEINDALGFSHGDQILCEFGQRLRDSVPESALVVRLRGDEFALLLPGCDAQTAQVTLHELDDRLSHPFVAADIALDVNARVGMVLYPQHATTVQDLLRQVDIAVHEARKQGRSHLVFDPVLGQRQSQHLNMVGELRRAIENNELRVYLQPKVEFSSGLMSGAEALIRWQHPRRGLLSPGVFIELAEHTGLINPLTEWMITRVLDLLQSWQVQHCALPIAVNLSACNLRDERLCDKIQQWQHKRGVNSGLLELELTESTLMHDAEFALRMLYKLRDQGIPLYIDDFGTGYSSLSYLQKLPVEYIKIDQSFVALMGSSHDSVSIVRSIIDLAHDLGRKTVAEGVETMEEWNLLAGLGCDFAQGYYIARPMAADVFQDWARTFTPP